MDELNYQTFASPKVLTIVVVVARKMPQMNGVRNANTSDVSEIFRA